MRNEFAKVLTVSPFADNSKELMRISGLLDIDKSKLVAEGSAARDFFNNKMNLSYFEKIAGHGDDAPF